MESYEHVSHEIFCPKTIFAREGMPFEKNKLVVRLASLLFLYNHEACMHGKAHLIRKISKFKHFMRLQV